MTETLSSLQIPARETPGQHKTVQTPTHACHTGCGFGPGHTHTLGGESNASTAASPSPALSYEHLTAPPGAASSSAALYHSADHEGTLPDLISQYGNSSALAWLDSEKYKIWRPSQPIPDSEFTPAQGYIQKESFIFAWGNPLVSSHAALEKTARAFIAFVESNHMHLVWCCVDQELEAILASDALGWSTMSCIYEDVMDPEHVVEVIDHNEHLKNHLAHAHKDHVEVREVKRGEWDPMARREVETGIREWRAHRHGFDTDSPLAQPWLDEEHRRYWLATRGDKVVGFEALACVAPNSWQIVKCISFHHSIPGIAEKLITTALGDLYTEQRETEKEEPSLTVVPPEAASEEGATVTEASLSEMRHRNRISVSFGISAAEHLSPGHNIGGWKISVLSRTYKAVSGMVGLLKTTQFRKQFDPKHEPMFICYPDNRFGFLSIGPLLMALRK
ncbi:hypothetical protein BDN70DRAFT_795507 [Pholiota conissans]|uniref:Phosphatidylglycerol lysyltransferase C-terminal domain-containing protein n=1 Tax=Pholiota conissans TaxID=109636 RepID=A0A9P5ZEQ4_9AGAR|nr:hypothetical protein BDN70DRAFT_795507 [Pholiota conissans]